MNLTHWAWCAAAICILTAAIFLAPMLLARHSVLRAEAMLAAGQIGNEAARQRLAQTPEAGAVRFAVLGDLQAGTGMMGPILNAVRAEGPLDFIVQTGDFVARPRLGHYAVSLAEWRESSAPDAPLFVVPGNHDVRESSADLTRSTAFAHYFGDNEFAFRRGRDLFVFADNSMTPFTDGQLDWIEATLAQERATADRVFFFMHAEPIWWEGNGKDSLEILYSRFFDMMETYSVDYVFTGNWHGYHRETRRGTEYIVNGHGGDFDRDDQLAEAHYTVVEAAPGGAVSVEKRIVASNPAALAESYFNDRVVARWGYFLYDRAQPVVYAAAAVSLLAAVWSFLIAQGLAPPPGGGDLGETLRGRRRDQDPAPAAPRFY